METKEAGPQPPEQKAPPTCEAEHEGQQCPRPAAARGPYGFRCEEHVPRVSSSYSVKSFEAVVLVCGQCGVNHRLEEPQVIGLAKFNKPINGVFCRSCGHLLEAKPEGAIITNPGPVAHMQRVMARADGRRR
jgi:hypothetical protein